MKVVQSASLSFFVRLRLKIFHFSINDPKLQLSLDSRGFYKNIIDFNWAEDYFGGMCILF